MDQILLQLTLYGLITQGHGTYRWTIPLVCDTLRADPERVYRRQRLLQELPAHFAAWITPQMGGGRPRDHRSPTTSSSACIPLHDDP
jgi:hypothetical protein